MDPKKWSREKDDTLKKGSGQQTEIEAEVRRLKRENEFLRQEHDI